MQYPLTNRTICAWDDNAASFYILNYLKKHLLSHLPCTCRDVIIDQEDVVQSCSAFEDLGDNVIKPPSFYLYIDIYIYAVAVTSHPVYIQ